MPVADGGVLQLHKVPHLHVLPHMAVGAGYRQRAPHGRRRRCVLLIALGGVDRPQPSPTVQSVSMVLGPISQLFSDHCVSPQDGAGQQQRARPHSDTRLHIHSWRGPSSVRRRPAGPRAFAPERLAPWQAPRISQNRSGKTSGFAEVHTHYNRLAEILKGYFDIWPDFFHPDKSRGTFPGKAGEKDNGPSAKGGRSVRKRHFAAVRPGRPRAAAAG